MSTKNLGIKRIMQEAKELSEQNAYEYSAHPLEDNLFEWHFTVRGPEDTEFEGGRYHGRILLPSDYPFKPPEIMFLTPNGRFELHKKICLSVTGFHPEFWQPAWGIRTILLAIIAFFPTHAKGAIGGLDYTKKERARLAKESNKWICSDCHLRSEDALTGAKLEKAISKDESVPELSLSYKAVEPSSSKPTTDRPTRLNARSKQGLEKSMQLRKMVLTGIMVSFLAMIFYSIVYG